MRQYNYTQLVIGMCGHVCQAWPLVQKLGGKPEVICQECTEAKYGLNQGDAESVWVFIDKDPQDDEGVLPKVPAKRKSTPRKKAAPVCTVCRRKGHQYLQCPLLVGQTELPFNG